MPLCLPLSRTVAPFKPGLTTGLTKTTDANYRSVMAVTNTGMKPPNRIRDWRLQLGYSLEEVADLTGLSIAMLSRVERGQRQLSPAARVAVARRLGVPIRELFDVEELTEASA